MIPKEATEANRATYWYPRLEDTRLPVPDARLAEMDCMEDRDYLHGFDPPDLRPDDYDPPTFDPLRDLVDAVGPPVFVRSDLSSAKHSGLPAVKVTSADEVGRAAWAILEHHEMDFLGANPTHWMVRPWIRMAAGFHAFGHPKRDDGLPIPAEYRVFATRDGEHVCTHFYWPTDAFTEHNSPPDAEQRLVQMREATIDDVPELEALACRAAKALRKVPAWSVDFALGREPRKWWLIDVADARTSWHPESCSRHDDLRQGVDA